MKIAHKVAFIGGNNREELASELDQCLDYIEEEYSIEFTENIREGIIEDHVRTPLSSFAGDNEEWHTVSIISKFPSRTQPEDKKTPDEYLYQGFDMEDVDELIVADPSKISAESVVDLLEGYGSVTIASSGVTLRKGVATEDVHRIIPVIRDTPTTVDGDEILVQDWPGGRPPLGTATSKGRLIKGENFNSIRNTLQMVAFGETSKSQAARDIGCARKTIGNTLRDRPEMYDLPRQ